jgi:hypothetical protein
MGSVAKEHISSSQRCKMLATLRDFHGFHIDASTLSAGERRVCTVIATEP